MTMQFVLILVLCLLSFAGTIVADTDIRFTLPTPVTVQGITLPAGEYVARGLPLPNDPPFLLLYSADGRIHKATLSFQSEPDDYVGSPTLTLDRVNGTYQLTSIHVQGRLLTFMK